MADLQTEALEGVFLKNGRYRVDKRVAHGAFGAFHLGYDTVAKKKVAIKFEKANAERPQLNLEFNFYKTLNFSKTKPESIPSLYYFDSVNDEWSALVIELLGPSLKAMYSKCEGFSVATTVQLLIQLTIIMEYVHDCKILYRDVKPDNFLMGHPNTPRWCKVHLIGKLITLISHIFLKCNIFTTDLGCAKNYVDENNVHIPFIEGKVLAGTMRFSSANNQQGREICRKDDLEALLYQAVYFYKKELPWDGYGQEIAHLLQRNIAIGLFLHFDYNFV